MKNVQIIDGAENCTYSIYQINDENFSLLFPEICQDIEFIDDLFDRLGDQKAEELLSSMWERRIDKRSAVGIHGTLFYQMQYKKKYYPNKRDADLDDACLQKKIGEADRETH